MDELTRPPAQRAGLKPLFEYGFGLTYKFTPTGRAEKKMAAQEQPR
jgi:hypothetical protein